ncbi:hypothetical protein E3N88_39716 [Mikania micrantha]|uniref:Uncharacterized protein n=1 Tax=Mikania micrantha TaxID=192012 RepID=A0A5N6LKK6_9ASTR|nr:hypothetical protein E3N88_39716 [Mikania micrantha]
MELLKRRHAALNSNQLDCWVMNVVPVSGPNTLPVIYDRELLEAMHNCEFTFPMDKLEHLVISSKNECSYSKLMYHFMDAYGHDVLIDSGPYEMTMLQFEADQKLGFWEDKRSHGACSNNFSLDTASGQPRPVGTSTVIVVKRLNHEGIQGHQDWLVLVKYDRRSEQEFF